MVGSSGMLLRTCSLLSKTLHVCGVSFLCFQGADCTLSSILAPLSGDHLFYEAGPVASTVLLPKEGADPSDGWICLVSDKAQSPPAPEDTSVFLLFP